jgi:hypothetical protein
MGRLANFSRVKDHWEVCPLSRPVMLPNVDMSDATGISSITEKPSLSP